MVTYINTIIEILRNSIQKDNNFNIIKLENFTTPEIYLEVSKNLEEFIKDTDMEFVAKLSVEKYNEWIKIDEYAELIRELENKGWVEKREHLTKWRNYAFTGEEKKVTVLLLGTEEVEDKGGLEEFYTISPENIENYVSENYYKYLGKTNIDEEEQKKINNVITNIFKYTEKDLLKLSDYFNSNNFNSSIELIDDMFKNLYKWWGIPNIFNAQGDISNNNLTAGNIEIIEKAYKFSRRIGLDVYQREKRLHKLEEEIDNFYNSPEKFATLIYEEIGDYIYSSESLKKDLINYLKGIKIDQVKNKLFEIDFMFINKLLRMSNKIPGGNKKDKATKIKGDPFETLSLPILLGINELNEIEKEKIKKIRIVLNKIVLSKTTGTKAEDLDVHSVLVNKWYGYIHFLNNIEFLIRRQSICNMQGEEIEVEIVYEDNEKNYQYPFDMDNTKELVELGILKSAKESETNSKIDLVYEFEICGEVIESKYQWIISEEESWTQCLKILEDDKFNELLNNDCEVLPIGYSEKVDLLINSKNDEEFYYHLNCIQFNYTNILTELNSNSELFNESISLGKTFSELMINIKETGIFDVIFNKECVVKFIKKYEDLINKVTFILKNQKQENKDINILSKAFLLTNDSEYFGKEIKGVVVPIYNPVMLEKVSERYCYLSNAFKELFDEIMVSKDISMNRIKSCFVRFDQLSTITFSNSVFLGKRNNFVTCKNSYGFFNVYGETNEKNIFLSDIAEYGDIDYEDDEKISLESSPISKYISYTIKEYLKTYPAKMDGFTLSFIKPSSYRDIIAGINEMLKILKKQLDSIMKINLLIYIDDFRAQGAKYFTKWIENNFTEDDNVILESSIKLLDYKELSTSVIEKYFEKSIEKSDIIFFNNVMEPIEIIPEYVNMSNIDSSDNRFPTVYLPTKCFEEKFRKLNITQRQFSSEYKYSQFMSYLREPNSTEAEYRIIKKVAISNQDYILLDKLHDKSNWVVVLDENIDIKVLNSKKNKVIGFSSGEGYFGELNSTISSKITVMDDLRRLIKRRLKIKFASWSQEELYIATNKCLEMTKLLDGAEILKAINTNDDAVNNYLAYLMTYEMIRKNKSTENLLLKKVISLDSYRHLFEDIVTLDKDSERESRPDLLVFELNNNNDGKIKIDVKIIECKLALESYEHIYKARSQVEAGYRHFTKIWNPSNDTVQRRYWFNQLYRILSYNNDIEVNQPEFDLTPICEGDFEINFTKELYLYWLDTEEENKLEILSGEDKSIKENHFSKKQIFQLLVEEELKEEIRKVVDVKSKEDEEKNNKKDLDIPEKKLTVDSIYTNENDTTKVDIEADEKEIAIADGNIVSNDIIKIFKEYENNKLENEILEIKEKFNRLKLVLGNKKIKIIQKDFILGPDIVRYCFDLDFTNDVNDVIKNQKNIQHRLSLNEPPYIFIEDGLIKMDTPRKVRQMVGIKTMYKSINDFSDELKGFKDHFYVLIGSDVLGKPYLLDLSDSNSPHLLIAGQTGSGKSVLLSSILVSVMSLYTPDEVEMVLLDPKRVELTAFRDGPYTKSVATEVDKVIDSLKDLLSTMEERYKLFEKESVKNISEYNSKNPNNKLKRVLMVFDEYGILMQADKENVKVIESTIIRLSQEARAAGVHLIICTQTPKAEIITTTIRNNLNARIGLKVADSNASKVILDESGAETLLGKGDMWIKTADSPKLTRIKSPYVSSEEIEEFMIFLKGKYAKTN